MIRRYEWGVGSFLIQDDLLGICVEDRLGELCQTHYPNGAIRSVTYQKGGKLHGPSIYYSLEGEVLSEGWYVEGMKMGKTLRYYKGGELYGQEGHFEGLIHRSQSYYYPGGKLKTSFGYDLGRLHGVIQLFWPSGLLKRESYFCLGIKEKDQFYDEEGMQIGALEPSVS